MKEKTISITIKQGHCPNCDSDDLNYQPIEVENHRVVYPFTCQTCGFEGLETYLMEFAGVETHDGDFFDDGSVIEVRKKG